MRLPLALIGVLGVTMAVFANAAPVVNAAVDSVAPDVNAETAAPVVNAAVDNVAADVNAETAAAQVKNIILRDILSQSDPDDDTDVDTDVDTDDDTDDDTDVDTDFDTKLKDLLPKLKKLYELAAIDADIPQQTICGIEKPYSEIASDLYCAEAGLPEGNPKRVMNAAAALFIDMPVLSLRILRGGAPRYLWIFHCSNTSET